MSHLNEHGITHLRHVDLAVPDYDTQRSFYKDVWGLTEVGTDGDLSYLAAEGSPEQYIVRLRQDDQKRLDLIAFGMTDAARPCLRETAAASCGAASATAWNSGPKTPVRRR